MSVLTARRCLFASPVNAATSADSPPTTAANVAEACRCCAEACHRVLTDPASRLDDRGVTDRGAPERLVPRLLLQECRDLCRVTASILSRPTTTAPAICQACSDACSRVLQHADLGRRSSVEREVSMCRSLCLSMADGHHSAIKD
ncbi:MAG: hypothetical protein KDA89_23940 [Planctomycetaceae bacterium]|nr:hypothetical protein [Planctomycetaceae bacterium]